MGSLLFDLEDAESGSRAASNTSATTTARDRIALLCAPTTPYAARLLRDVRCFRRALLREAGRSADEASTSAEVCTVELATKLSSVGYTVNVRNALGGGGSCFRNLRHEFLVVRGSGETEGVDYIVDLHFREQFEIPQPTSAYLEVLSQVPEQFVGPIGRLLPVVQALGAEMAESFKARGLTVPPWRKTQSMLSKWMPAKALDRNVSDTGMGGAASPDNAAMSTMRDAAAAAITNMTFQRISADMYVQVSSSPRQSPTKGGLTRRLTADSELQQKIVKIGFAL